MLFNFGNSDPNSPGRGGLLGSKSGGAQQMPQIPQAGPGQQFFQNAAQPARAALLQAMMQRGRMGGTNAA